MYNKNISIRLKQLHVCEMLTVSTGTYCKKTQTLHVSKRTIRYAESMVDQVYIEIYSFYVILKYNHFCHCDLEALHCFNYKKKH